MTQTMAKPTTRIFRNDVTGYTVTLTDNGRGGARVVDSLDYEFPMVGSDYPYAATLAESRARLNGAVEIPAPAASQIVSPLAPADRAASMLARGATLTRPEPAQARCLEFAAAHQGVIRRGPSSITGATATFSQLIGMARRGWLTLDNGVRPSFGTITQAGRNAVAGR